MDLEDLGISSRTNYEPKEMMVDEGYSVNPMHVPGFRQTTNFHPKYAESKKKEKKKSLIAKFFSNMSRLGMDYEDDVIANMRAIPADKSLLPKQEQLINQDLFSATGKWKEKSNADKNFFEKDFNQKREALRKLALQPELEDILDTMTNESIVYDSDYTYFMEPFVEIQELKEFKPAVRKQINDIVDKSFKRFYKTKAKICALQVTDNQYNNLKNIIKQIEKEKYNIEHGMTSRDSL